MKLKITQTKSTIACLKKQIATIEALGLHKIGQTVIKQDNPATRGMIFRISTCSVIACTNRDSNASRFCVIKTRLLFGSRSVPFIRNPFSSILTFVSCPVPSSIVNRAVPYCFTSSRTRR